MPMKTSPDSSAILARKNLETAQREERKVRVTRSFSGEEHTSGFVLDVGDEVAIIQQFHDFYEEGCCIVRVSDVVGVRSDVNERFWETMFAAEGIRRRAAAPFGLQATTMADALRACMQAGAGVIVECETDDSENDTFHLGVIEGLDEEAAEVRPLDPLGAWGASDRLLVTEITKVHVDTPYVNTYIRYARTQR